MKVLGSAGNRSADADLYSETARSKLSIDYTWGLKPVTPPPYSAFPMSHR